MTADAPIFWTDFRDKLHAHCAAVRSKHHAIVRDDAYYGCLWMLTPRGRRTALDLICGNGLIGQFTGDDSGWLLYIAER